MSGDNQILSFGEFTLDTDCRILTKDRDEVQIQDKPLDLLIFLIMNRDRVVSREEIIREVWPGVAVGPQALGFALHALRATIGDDGRSQRILKTFIGRGIQFVATVTMGDKREEYQPPYPLPFLNRESLHREAGQALATVLRGSGQILLIHGEAGVGKTRSLQHIRELAQARGFKVSQGHGVQGDQAPAYWPWVQVLRDALPAAPVASQSSIIDDGALQLASLIPELRAAVGEVSSKSLEDSRTTRFLLFDGVSRFLRAMSSVSPICILIDDLQFTDPGSLALFEHLARDLCDARILLIGAYRDIDARASDQLANTISVTAHNHSCRVLEVTALPLAGIEEFVTSAYGVIPSALVTDHLSSRTNGNPFFLGQILRVLDGEQRLAELTKATPPEVELPLQIRTAICRQVSVLPWSVVQVLEAAAVAGRDFRVSDIQKAFDIAAGEISDALDIAAEAGVIKRCSIIGAFSFTHVLVRDAIYRSLSANERIRLHQVLAAAIENDLSADIGPRAAELAYHYSRTLTADGVTRAVRYAEAAAQWAAQRAGFEEAVAQLEHAESMLVGAGLVQGEDRCRVLIKLGDARVRAGDRQGGNEALREASLTARAGSFSEMVATAALRYAPDFLAIETGICDGEQVAILEDAIIAIGRNNDRIRAQLLARLAVALHWSDEAHDRRKDLIAEALNLATTVGEEDVKRFVETAGSLAAFSVEEPERLLSESSLECGGGGPLVLLMRRLIRITSLWLLGRMGLVRIELEEFGVAVRRLRQPQADWYETLLRATLALMEGHFARASVLAQQFFQRGEFAGDRNARESFMLQSFMSSVDLGKVHEFEDGVRGMAVAFPRVVGWRGGLLLLLAETGRFAEANEILDELMAGGALEREKRNEWYALVGAMAIGAARVENSRHAERIYTALRPHGHQLAVVGYGSFCWGSTEQLLGLCAMAAGENRLAEAHLLRAVEANRSAGAIPAIARSHGDLALCLNRQGRAAEALDHGQACLGISRRLGMERVVDRISNLLSL